jgi:adenine/guanine phosphoribosyltransferase-like PRPP-binding protein
MSYLSKFTMPRVRKEVADKAASEIKDALLSGKLRPFDAVAVTGISGMLLGPEIATNLYKDLIVIRKAVDKSNHSSSKVEYYNRFEDVLLVDDGFSSGETLRNMQAILKDQYKSANIVGVYLYNDGFIFDAPGNTRLITPDDDDFKSIMSPSLINRLFG